jgi:hypothetical protein
VTNILSPSERDSISNLLAAEHVILHLIFARKSQESTTFRVETGADGLIVTKEGTIRFMKAPPKLDKHEDETATVIFYFKKLGLTFTSRLEQPNQLYEIFIPKTIFRLPDENASQDHAVLGRLFFSITGNADVSVACVPQEEMPLFKYETWKYFTPENAEEGAGLICNFVPGTHKSHLPMLLFRALDQAKRLLYAPGGELPQESPFDFDVCVLHHEWNTGTPEGIKLLVAASKLDQSFYMPLGAPPSPDLQDGAESFDQDGLAISFDRNANEISPEKVEELISKTALCNFLTRPADVLASAALPDQHQLTIAYLSDKLVLLGGPAARFPLTQNQEYAFQLIYRSGLLSRAIYTTCFVSEMYTEPQGKRSCALCLFTSLKAEDRRFIFETLYGTIFR